MNYYTDGEGMFWRVLPTGVVQSRMERARTWMSSCFKSEAQLKKQPYMKKINMEELPMPRRGRPTVERKKAVANLSFDPDLLARIKAAAKQAGRNTSAFIAEHMEDALA